MNEANALTPFSNGMELATTEVGALAAITREESEIKAGIQVARHFPRDEQAAYTQLLRSCERPRFAESARYIFPRGGKEISGASVDMAREAARCWGNIRYGLRMVSNMDGMVHIKGFAHDMQKNNYVEAEDKFKNLIQRKDKKTQETQWVPADERDLRELINRRGAILVRNCILQILPPDVIDDAEDKVIMTLKQKAAGELKQNKGEVIKSLVLAFDSIAINTEMLTAKLGHSLELLTEDELADLRSIYKSIVDGNTKRDDHFTFESAQEAKAASVAEKIRAKNAEIRKAQEAAKAESEPAKPEFTEKEVDAKAPSAEEVKSGQEIGRLPAVDAETGEAVVKKSSKKTPEPVQQSLVPEEGPSDEDFARDEADLDKDE